MRRGVYMQNNCQKKGWLFALFGAGSLLYCYWQNHYETLRSIQYENKSIPKAFDGFRIVHISDLHNKYFGRKQQRLLATVAKANPDIIVITGDLIDRRRPNIDAAMKFIYGAVKLAPVYYVPGNHEARAKEYAILSLKLEEAGVINMADRSRAVICGGEDILLLGLSDPWFHKNTALLAQQMRQKNTFKILLAHRPELINQYAQYDIDLVFSGHAHGGQFRIPFFGAVYAPKQGIFPKYTSGPYAIGSTTLIVSRGLGNSLFPIRLNNRPEVVCVTLKRKEKTNTKMQGSVSLI